LYIQILSFEKKRIYKINVRRNGNDNNKPTIVLDFRNERTRCKLPALFIGHGSPMNGIEDNEFSNTWKN
jgi:hypothetical protein